MRTLALLLCCSGCAVFLPAPTPMTSLRDELPGGDAKCLVVFLPGAGDKASDFLEYGFIEALRQKNLSVDVVAADATLGYYARGIFRERVHTDVVAPARAKGYQQTWVMGMSMGGMGTLLYAHEHAADVSGVLLLAPYLGDPSLSDEIRAAGGLAAWKGPVKEAVTSETYQREVWRWLQAVTANTEVGPKLYLGWGTEDRLGESASLLAGALPEERVFKVPGAHKWTSWKAVLERFLVESDFVRACACERHLK